MPPPHRDGTTRRIAGLTLAWFLIACDSTQQPPADSAAVAAPSTAAATSPGEDWLNALSGDELFAALNDGKRWTKSTDSPQQRKCLDPAACGATGRVGVNLWVEKNAYKVGDAMAADTAIMIGKLGHVGGAGESRMYRVRPGPYLYAVFILKGDAAKGRYQIRELNTATKQHTAHASGDWLRCVGADHPIKTAAEAQFRSCEAPHAAVAGGITHENPAWFTCAEGCCTAGSLN